MYNFSALPGGYGHSGGLFYNVGNYGSWWSSFEYNSNNAYFRLMIYDDEDADYTSSGKSSLYSVRCLKD